MKCPYCGAETRYAKCEFCDSVISQSASETVNEVLQDVTRNIKLNINKTANDTTKEVSKKRKSTSIILCCLGFFLLGGFHRLYTGHILTGLLWLCTVGCFGIGTIVDLISIITNNFYDSKERRISQW